MVKKVKVTKKKPIVRKMGFPFEDYIYVVSGNFIQKIKRPKK